MFPLLRPILHSAEGSLYRRPLPLPAITASTNRGAGAVSGCEGSPGATSRFLMSSLAGMGSACRAAAAGAARTAGGVAGPDAERDAGCRTGGEDSGRAFRIGGMDWAGSARKTLRCRGDMSAGGDAGLGAPLGD